MSDIYNKNAREKALLEEAYGNVYNEELKPMSDAESAAYEHKHGKEALYRKEDEEEHPATRAAEEMIGADVMWDGRRKRGIVDEVDVESGVAIVIDDDGGEHIVELGDFDVVLDPNTETPGELKHDYGIEDAEDITTKFQPGQFVDVLGDDGEFSHQEVVLKVTGDVVNTIRAVGEGKPYGDTAKGYYDINLISPQDLEAGKYSAEPTGYHEW